MRTQVISVLLLEHCVNVTLIVMYVGTHACSELCKIELCLHCRCKLVPVALCSTIYFLKKVFITSIINYFAKYYLLILVHYFSM